MAPSNRQDAKVAKARQGVIERDLLSKQASGTTEAVAWTMAKIFSSPLATLATLASWRFT